MKIRIVPTRLRDIEQALDSGIIKVSEEVASQMSKLYKSNDGDMVASMVSVINGVAASVHAGSITTPDDVIMWVSQSLHGLIKAKQDNDRKEFESWMDSPAYGEHKQV